jgi:hypothetical protein
VREPCGGPGRNERREHLVPRGLGGDECRKVAPEVMGHVEKRAQGRGVASASQAPQRKGTTPGSRATKAATSAVLPTPASPETEANWPRVCDAVSARDSSRSASSRSSSIMDTSPSTDPWRQ